MTISIKSLGGVLQEPPVISDLKVVGNPTQNSIDISYKVTDAELQIVRHYIIVKTSTSTIYDKKEITKDVHYESPNNIFSYTIAGLEKDTTYTIQIAVFDGLDEAKSDAVTAKTKKDAIVGFIINNDIADIKNPNRVTYIEGAEGVTPATASGLGEWENMFPFKDMILVGIKNGAEIKEINKNNKKQYIDGTPVPSDVDVYLRIPKIYMKVEKQKNSYICRLSEKPLSGGYINSHIHNSSEMRYLYIAVYRAFEENGKLRSVSGEMANKYVIQNNSNYFNSRKKARNNNSNCELHLWSSDQLLIALYFLAFKSTDSKILGEHLSEQTGTADTKGFLAKGTNSTASVFLGIEDLWGVINYRDRANFLDGLVMQQSKSDHYNPEYKRQRLINLGNKYNLSGADAYANYTVLDTLETRYNCFEGYYMDIIGQGVAPFIPLEKGKGTSSTYFSAFYEAPGCQTYGSGGYTQCNIPVKTESLLTFAFADIDNEPGVYGVTVINNFTHRLNFFK